jgi:hypothetical protein
MGAFSILEQPQRWQRLLQMLTARSSGVQTQLPCIATLAEHGTLYEDNTMIVANITLAVAGIVS